MINNPPAGLEGDLYAEISRSKPAPQGICVANSSGKVLAWVLSFDDPSSLPKFLDYARERYEASPDNTEPVTAERFMRFPSRRLEDVADSGKQFQLPAQHDRGDRCPALPRLESGTLVGHIVGRPLDKNGQPIAETFRQEDYLEARWELPPATQSRFLEALREAGEQRFRVPAEFARAVVSHAYLGQLDVSPLGGRQIGGQTQRDRIELHAQRMTNHQGPGIRVRIEGTSDVAGAQGPTGQRTDGRLWEHEVQLQWQGYADVNAREGQIGQIVLLAEGNERLKWGGRRLLLADEPDVAHLMAGHPIDLACDVRYGMLAEPCEAHEVVADTSNTKPQPASDNPQPGSADWLAVVLGPRFVALHESTWKELELSREKSKALVQWRDQQAAQWLTKLQQLQQLPQHEQRPQFEQFRRQAGEVLEEKLSELLSPKQLQGLRRMELRRLGMFAAMQPDIARELALSDEQRSRIQGIVQQMQREMQSLADRARDGGAPQRARREAEQLRQQAEQNVRDVLTQSQQQQWQRLVQNQDP
jgi:hypothetical protein